MESFMFYALLSASLIDIRDVSRFFPGKKKSTKDFQVLIDVMLELIF
jgi:hypothetical protein